MSKVTIYTDGASHGNPGDAGIGVVIASEDGTVLREISEYIGKQTNNVAEYTALIAGLRAAADLGATEVEVSTDSELMARQISGVYKVKSPHLAPLYNEAMSLLRCFRRCSIGHVYRESNERADFLAGEAVKANQKRVKIAADKPKPTRPKAAKPVANSPRPAHKPPVQIEFEI